MSDNKLYKVVISYEKTCAMLQESPNDQEAFEQAMCRFRMDLDFAGALPLGATVQEIVDGRARGEVHVITMYHLEKVEKGE